MLEIFKKAQEFLENRQSFALCTVVESKGSTPGRQNFKMLVTKDKKILGTIGGGAIEALVIEEAASLIGLGKSKLQSFVLDSGKSKGIEMLCGGENTVYIEVFTPPPQVIIAGGGHVGLEVARLCSQLGYDNVAVDSRSEFSSSERFGATTRTLCCDYDKLFENLLVDEETYIVIATHNSDQKVLEGALRTKAKYIGMIGSKKKVIGLIENIKNLGYEREDLKRLHSPIGLDIGAQSPAEIAVSIMAQIIGVYKGSQGLKNSLVRGSASE